MPFNKLLIDTIMSGPTFLNGVYSETSKNSRSN